MSIDWKNVIIQNIDIEYKVPIINFENDSIKKLNEIMYNIEISIIKKGKKNIYNEKNINYKSKNINNIIKNIFDKKLNKLDIDNYNLYKNYDNFKNNNKYYLNENNSCINNETYNYSLKKWLIPIVEEKKNIYINTYYKSIVENNYINGFENMGISLNIPNLNYTEDEKGDENEKKYNILNILSFGHIKNQMILFFKDSIDEKEGVGERKETIDNNNLLTLSYFNYRTEINNTINNRNIDSIEELNKFIEEIKEIENNYFEYTDVNDKQHIKLSKINKIKDYLDIFEIDNINKDKKFFIEYFKFYKKKFEEQDKINQFYSKELYELQTIWRYKYSNEKKRFIDLKETEININKKRITLVGEFNKFKNYLQQIEVDENMVFKLTDEYIYKSSKIIVSENTKEIINNKINFYALTDLNLGQNLIETNYNDEFNLINSVNINERYDIAENINLKIINNLNNENNFINLFEEINYETEYSNIYNSYASSKNKQQFSGNIELDNITNKLKNYIKEDNYTQIIKEDNYSQIYKNNKYVPFNLIDINNQPISKKQLYLYKPWLSNYIIESNDHLIDTNIKTQVVRNNSELITNMNFHNSIGVDNYGNFKITENRRDKIDDKLILSSNRFSLENKKEIRTALPDETLNIKGFYYKDPIKDKLNIHYLGDKTTFINKLNNIKTKNLFKGFKNIDFNDYENNFIELYTNEKKSIKNEFTIDKIINNIQKITINDKYLLNINSINNILKDYDYNVKILPHCFIKNLNKILLDSNENYKQKIKDIALENKKKLKDNYNILRQKKEQYNKKIEDGLVKQSLMNQNYLVNTDEDQEINNQDIIESLNSQIITSGENANDTYFIIQPNIIEIFFEYADKIINNKLNDIEIKEIIKIIDNNQCWFFDNDKKLKPIYNGNPIESLDEINKINIIFNTIIYTLYKNKNKSIILDQLSIGEIPLDIKMFWKAKELLFELLYDFEYDIDNDIFTKVHLQRPFLSLLSDISNKYTTIKEILENQDNKQININYKKMIKIPISKGSKNNKNELVNDAKLNKELKELEGLKYYNSNNKTNKNLLKTYYENINEINSLSVNEEEYIMEKIYPLSYNISNKYNEYHFIKGESKLQVLDDKWVISNIDGQVNDLHTQINETRKIYRKNKDRTKKLYNCYEEFVNPYSLIDKISIKPPNISRAYNKLWELLTFDNDNIYKKITSDNPKIIFIAEAPGGFIHCINNIRVNNNKKTLIENNNFDIITFDEKNILQKSNELPTYDNWDAQIVNHSLKNESTFLQKKFIIIFYKYLLLNKKEDNTIGKYVDDNLQEINKFIEFDRINDEDINNSGNVINIDTLGKIFNYYDKNEDQKADIITADGGFDIKDNEKEYEELILSKLYFGEIITAIFSQKKGGAFIIKINSMFSETTKNLLYLLSIFYNKIQIVKPYTSKVYNNEKYVKCYNFKGIEEIHKIQLKESLLSLLTEWNNEENPENFNLKISDISDMSEDYIIFTKNIENINTNIVLRQYNHYLHLFNFIEKINEQKKIENKIIKLNKTLQQDNNNNNIKKQIRNLTITSIESYKLSLAFNNYCKIYNSNDLQFINAIFDNKNENLAKFMIYSLKKSLILIKTINLPSYIQINKYSDSILYILQDTQSNSDEKEYHIQNPYMDEINLIEEENEYEFIKKRDKFIETKCSNYENNSLIRYNLYNEIQKLEKFDNDLINDLINDDNINWYNWLIATTTKEEFNRINDNIIEKIILILKNIDNFSIEDDEFKHIINNIKKFFGWHLDTINFTKCFCRHIELEEKYYLNDKNICIFCGDNLNNKDIIDNNFEYRVNQDNESLIDILDTIIYSHFNNTNIFKDINDLDKYIETKITWDEFYLYFEEYEKTNDKNKIIIKEMILVFYKLTYAYNNIIKHNRRKIPQVLEKAIQGIINNNLNNASFNYYIQNLLNEQLNISQILSDQIKKNDFFKTEQNFTKYKEDLKKLFTNDEFIKNVVAGDMQHQTELRHLFKINIKQEDNIFINDTYLSSIITKVIGGSAESELLTTNSTESQEEKICHICGQKEKTSPYSINLTKTNNKKEKNKRADVDNRIEYFKENWEEKDWDMFNQINLNYKRTDLGKLIEEKGKYYHKFCKDLLKSKNIKDTNKTTGQIFPDIPKTLVPKTVHKIYNKIDNSLILFNLKLEDIDKIIETINRPFQLKTETDKEIQKYITNINKYIYYNLLKLELILTNNYYQNIIYYKIIEYVYDKYKSIYIKKLSLIYYCLELFKIILNENEKIKYDNKLTDLLNIFIKTEIFNTFNEQTESYNRLREDYIDLLKNINISISNSVDNISKNDFIANQIFKTIDNPNEKEMLYTVPEKEFIPKVFSIQTITQQQYIENDEDDEDIDNKDIDNKDIKFKSYIENIYEYIKNSQYNFYITEDLLKKAASSDHSIKYTDQFKLYTLNNIFESTIYNKCYINKSYNIKKNNHVINIFKLKYINLFNKNFNNYTHTINNNNKYNIKRGLNSILFSDPVYETRPLREKLYKFFTPEEQKLKLNHKIKEIFNNDLLYDNQYNKFINYEKHQINNDEAEFTDILNLNDYNSEDYKLFILTLKYNIKYLINLPFDNKFNYKNINYKKRLSKEYRTSINIVSFFDKEEAIKDFIKYKKFYIYVYNKIKEFIDTNIHIKNDNKYIINLLNYSISKLSTIELDDNKLYYFHKDKDVIESELENVCKNQDEDKDKILKFKQKIRMIEFKVGDNDYDKLENDNTPNNRDDFINQYKKIIININKDIIEYKTIERPDDVVEEVESSLENKILYANNS
jgi:hypothetical protein